MNKTAIVNTSLGRGGSERVTVILSEYLNKIGVDTEVVTIYKEDNEYTLSNSVKRNILLNDKENRKNKLLKILISIKKLRDVIKEKNIDTLIVMDLPLFTYSIPSTFFLKTKVIVSERNDPASYSGSKMIKIVSRFLMRFADGFVFQTNDAKNFYSKFLKGRGTVIYNPLESSNLPDVYNGKKEKIIVSMGRLYPQKNQKILIEAFANIANKIPDYKLIIYGEGPLRNEFESQIEHLNLKDRIILPGNFLDVHERIKKASLFVMTSDFEGMPNALIEAMAMGLPCISTDCPCGGPRELIIDGENGILVPVNDTLSLQESILKVLSDEKFANSLSKEGIKIRDKLSVEKIGKQWLDYINEIV